MAWETDKQDNNRTLLEYSAGYQIGRNTSMCKKKLQGYVQGFLTKTS